MRPGLALLGVASALAAWPAAACEPPAGAGAPTRVESPRFVVLYRTAPPVIAVGDYFTVHVVVCPKDAPAPTALSIDARMPEHRHGMNSRARVVEEAPGRYLADGLLFHMPGRWELLFEIDTPGARETLSDAMELP